MRIAVTIVVAALLGVAWVLLTARSRSRSRRANQVPRQVQTQAGGPIESVLGAYRSCRYDQVIDEAPAVLQALGSDDTSLRWRGRLELVLGHSYFERDRFVEAIPHLEAGLEVHTDERPTAEARFEHCLGYAYQQTGRSEHARAVYRRLLADEDLDPAVRDGAARHLDQLDELDDTAHPD